MTRSIDQLVLVTTSLRLEDGGMASLARMIATAMYDYCQNNNLAYEILDLATPEAMLRDLPVRYFGGSQLALARTVWRRVLASRRTAFVFLHVGPARTMSVIPDWLMPPYMVWLVGVEAWRPFGFDRRRAMQKADMRVAISAFTERRAREFHDWLPPTYALPLALEERPISGEPDTALLQQIGPRAVLIVGRLAAAERYKGHDELIGAMPAVLGQCPDAQLIITGKGDDMSRLQALAADLGVQQQVVFTGFVNDATLQALYARCHVFAMPSRHEGFGLVFLEAMKASRPCVALRDSAAAEIIEDGITGLLVDHDAPDQLAEVLLRLLQDEAYSRQLGMAGYQRWQAAFTRAAFNQQFQRLLDQLCGDN